MQALTTGVTLNDVAVGINNNGIYGIASRYDDDKVGFEFKLAQPFTGSGPAYFNVKLVPKDTRSPLYGKTLLNNEVPIKV